MVDAVVPPLGPVSVHTVTTRVLDAPSPRPFAPELVDLCQDGVHAASSPTPSPASGQSWWPSATGCAGPR